MPDGKSDGLAVLDDVLKLELPRRPKVIDIANAFQNLFGKAIEYRKSNPQDNARLVNLLVQEIDRAVKLHPEAKGWYDENVKLTMDVMRDLDPDLAKPENDFIFKAILAATSDGNKVGPQFQQTWKEYSNWKNTGEISGEFVSGDRIDNIQTNLEMLNEFIKDIGWEKTKDFMVQKGTVKDLRQALVDVFGWTKKQANSIGSSERVDEVVPFAVVLGPKLGSFFNNLYGDFSSVTMDRWFMRTLGRLTGTQVAPLTKAKLREMRNNLRDAVSRLTPSEFELLGVKRGDLRGTSIDGTATTIAGRFSKKALRETAKKSSEAGQSALEETRKFANSLKKGLNPLVEAPVDGTHRRWIRERIAEVQSELRSRGIELENADLQAVLWYLEKELYEKLNYRSKSGESDYASAASSLYQSVAGRPSDVYAGGTGRVRAIGSTGGSEGMGAGQAGQAPGPEVGGQRYMPAGDREVTRSVNINDKTQDFTGQILRGEKVIETRDTLKNAMQGVLGQRIGLTRTGTGDTKVVGYATVAKQPIVYRNESEFRRDQGKHLVEPGSKYDIKKGGVKYGYELTDVTPVEPFAPKSVSRMYSVIEPQRYMPASSTDIYRAGDKSETGVKAFSSWSENKSTAEAYLDNPGFGGSVLRSEKVPLNRVLDADTTNRKGMERLARQLGFDEGTGDEWFDNGWKYPWEESKSVKEALKRSGFDAIRYPDDFPEGATSIVPLKDFGGSGNNSFMPSPDSAMPGAYSFSGGYRAIPGKAKGSFRIYGPAGSLLGIASSLDEAQRILRRKTK